MQQDGTSTVKIKTMSGNCLEFQVELSLTVFQFKILIQQKTQIPTDIQKLLYLGKVLKDSQSLGSCEIKDGSVVHLVENKCCKEDLVIGYTPTTSVNPPGILPSFTTTTRKDPTTQTSETTHFPAQIFRMIQNQCSQLREQQISSPSKFLCTKMRSRCANATNTTNQTTSTTSSPCPQTLCDTELDQSIISGNLDRVRQLIEAGGNVNKGGLHKACMFGHIEIVRYFLSKGANLDLKLGSGETCLHTCAFYGQKEIIQYLLLNHEINIYERTNDGKTSLMLAVYNNHRSVAELLLQNGASVYDNDVNGFTSLILAAQKGNNEIVELLLSNGAKVDARDFRGRTALHFSAYCGFSSIMMILLQFNAPINAKNSKLETALNSSSCNAKIDCIEFLLSNGADVNIRSICGTALSLAISKGHKEIAELLRKHGAIE